MNPMAERIFVYGTLRLAEVQLEIIGREVELAHETLKGFKTEPVVIDGAEYRTLVPDKDSEIEGAIISVTNDELARIDAYEPEEYERIRVTAVSGTTVWVYVKS